MYKLTLPFFILAAIWAAPSFAADDVVGRELDAYAQANGLSAENISPPAGKPVRKRHEFELGTESYSYLYREFRNNGVYVKFKGFYGGLLFSYTFRPRDVDSLADMICNVFRVELRGAGGRVDYTGSGTWHGLHDYMYEARGILGHEFLMNPSLQAMPYVGLGYRYLNDGFQDIPARVVDGISYFSAYNRESTYCYIPVGVDVYCPLSKGWGVGGNVEYDVWITGQEVNHFEDMEADTGASAGWDRMKNDQKKGYGLRGSLKIDKVFPGMKLAIEPYYRYWKVEDSEKQTITGPGAPTASQLWEPQNTTHEIGLKVGLKF